MLDLLPLCPLGFVSLRTPLALSPLWAPLVWARSGVFNSAAGYLKKRAVAVAAAHSGRGTETVKKVSEGRDHHC